MKTSITTVLIVLSILVFAQKNDCKLSIGTNLGGISDWMTEMPFVDRMHNARTWGTRNSTGWSEGWKNEWNTELIDSIGKDENGYPLEVPFFIDGLALEDSQIVFTVWAIIDAWEDGVYTCFFDGEGELDFGGDGKIISKEPGKYKVQVTPSANGSFLEMKILRSKRGNHIRNIRLIMPGQEQTYQTQPFNPLYLERLSQFKALRFMDWGATNNWGHDNSWTCFDNPEDTILTRWDQRSSLTNYTWATNKGVPYEMMCDLCNTLGVDMWVCVPHSASVEYIREMAKLIKTKLNPVLKVYAEYGNENWNWMFGQTQWLNTFYCIGRGLDWPEGIVDPTQNNLDVWTEVYADNPKRLIRVVGVQTAWQDVANRIVKNLKPGSFDAVAITGYFGLGEQADTELDALGAKATTADVARLVRKEMVDNEIEWIKSDYDELGAPLKVPIIYYEAGQHITPTPFGEEPTYAQALLNIQRDTALYNIYHEWFERIEKLIPNGENALYMNFSFVAGLSARYGSWGVLETLDQDTSIIYAPKFQALMEQINYCGKPAQTNTAIKSLLQRKQEVVKLLDRGNGYYVVISQEPIKSVEVIDVSGKQLKQIDGLSRKEIDLQLPDISQNIYLLKIESERFSETRKISIKN